jgi:hypothetical protein
MKPPPCKNPVASTIKSITAPCAATSAAAAAIEASHVRSTAGLEYRKTGSSASANAAPIPPDAPNTMETMQNPKKASSSFSEEKEPKRLLYLQAAGVKQTSPN